jgi:hypothetical protein
MKVRSILIVSDTAWFCWAHVLGLFQSQPDVRVRITIMSPSKSMINLFGLNRDSTIQWKSLDLQQVVSSALALSVQQLVSKNDLVLFSGTSATFQTLSDIMGPPSTPVIACLLGQSRLRTLKRFRHMTWSRTRHAQCGGATTGIFWVGSSVGFRDGAQSVSPSACASAMKDLVEFAPKNMTAMPIASPDLTVLSSLQRASYSIPHQSCSSTYWSHGLFPSSTVSDLSNTYVATPSPFTPTKWCRRKFTAKEIARFFDLPVDCEKRLGSLHKLELPAKHPLLVSIPVKILGWALWLSGYCDNRRGVNKVDHSTSDVTKSKSDLLVSQEKFKSEIKKIDVKAVKHDDAAVPVEIWDEKLINEYPIPEKLKGISREIIKSKLSIIRKALIAKWRRLLLNSLLKYLQTTWKNDYTKYMLKSERNKLNSEFVKDLNGGVDCMQYASKSTWWEWPGGSRLFFWRWTPEFRRMARDGIPICWLPEKIPSAKVPQPKVPDAEVRNQMRKKLSKIRDRGYVQPGYVKSLIKFFAVPKGTSDVRMVYDGTASGFNEGVWVPSFGLPTVETLLRGTGPGTWMVDLDIGEMFLNFMLAEDARHLVGIDISQFFLEEIKEGKFTNWEIWMRCAMGLKVSPNHAIRALLHAEEFLLGNPLNKDNPFHTARVKLNLPGTEKYDPTLPWFSLMRFDDLLASILATFVDDERVHAASEALAWKCAHQIATREAYLGIQDAARKRRPPSQNAGAWAGSIVWTNKSEVGVLVSEERWLKTRRIVRKWLDIVRKDENADLNTKDLLSDRGFIIYISRTYRMIIPYLKGLHLTIDGWRQNRDDDGWKRATAHMKNLPESDFVTTANYPVTVKPVPRLKGDLEALERLTEDLKAPVLLIQSKHIYVVRYGFGDASGGGFGSSITDNECGLEIQIGTWTEAGTEHSSNFREFGNFVIRLEKDASEGKLKGAEVFMFTDNSTTESAFHNGTSTSKRLFELVLRLRALQLEHGAKIHMIHVAGTRMISQGTDGISRGNILEGVMAGKEMLSFIPISQTVCERSRLMLPWIRSWIQVQDLKPLSESQWFWEGQGLGTKMWTNCDGVKMPQKSEVDTFLWTPQPCIADVALEALRKSIHKRPDATHIFLCPKLMTYKWRKMLLRSCCFSFYIDVGPEYWNEDMFESVLCGVYLPLLPCPPWTFRRSKSILALERKLRAVSKGEGGTQGAVLRKFFTFSRKLPSMQEGVVRGLLSAGRIG